MDQKGKLANYNVYNQEVISDSKMRKRNCKLSTHINKRRGFSITRGQDKLRSL